MKKFIIGTLLKIGKYKPDVTKGRWRSGAAAGVGVAGLGATSLLSLLGFSAVMHSSGAIILTGAGGYIAGTFGFSALLVWFLTLPITIFVFVICLVIGFYKLHQKKLKKQNEA